MLQIITLPTALPIAVEEARLQVRQDINADDPLLRRGIGSAARFAESQTERTLLATRFRWVMDAFPGPSLMGIPAGAPFTLPGHAIQLPRSPLIQVVSIQYLDMAGAWQTLPSTDYVVDDSCPVPRITPVFGKIWPITLPQIGAVRVLFDAGYATPAVADAVADTLILGLWKPLVIGDIIRLSNSGGALPAPLQPNTDYYIQSVTAGIVKLATTNGGAAIPLTDTGAGLHYVGEVPDGIVSWMLARIDSLFVHRGETIAIAGKLEKLSYIDSLLDPYRTVML